MWRHWQRPWALVGAVEVQGFLRVINIASRAISDVVLSRANVTNAMDLSNVVELCSGGVMVPSGAVSSGVVLSTIETITVVKLPSGVMVPIGSVSSTFVLPNRTVGAMMQLSWAILSAAPLHCPILPSEISNLED